MTLLTQKFLSGAVLLMTVLAVVLLMASSVVSGRDLLSSSGGGDHLLSKKSFSSIGCMGTHDRSKFARLDRICEECYQLYRDTEIHKSCREFCFKNDVFPACVEALLLTHEQKELNDIAEELLG
ncbi:hypothetical protein TYRP_004009 [Tyrophagus putrescentiae]|nr:hypothetical protein TYRP_004009 [Tyrophagus putrescentiae]